MSSSHIWRLCWCFFRKLYPEHKEELEQLKAHLKESSNEMAPLKVWQLQGRASDSGDNNSVDVQSPQDIGTMDILFSVITVGAIHRPPI